MTALVRDLRFVVECTCQENAIVTGFVEICGDLGSDSTQRYLKSKVDSEYTKESSGSVEMEVSGKPTRHEQLHEMY